MKKLGVILAIALLAFILLAKLPKAEDVPTTKETVEKIIENVNSVSDSDTRNSYLKQEWIKIIDKHPVLKQIKNIVDKIGNFLNPFFKKILNVEFGYNWIFWATLIVWLIIISYIWKIFGLYDAMSAEIEWLEYFKFPIYIIAVLAISLTRLQNLAANWLVKWFTKDNSFAFNASSVIIVFAIILGVIFFKKYFDVFFSAIGIWVASKKKEKRTSKKIKKEVEIALAEKEIEEEEEQTDEEIAEKEQREIDEERGRDLLTRLGRFLRGAKEDEEQGDEENKKE